MLESHSNITKSSIVIFVVLLLLLVKILSVLLPLSTSLMYISFRNDLASLPITYHSTRREKRTGRIAVIQQPCDGVTYEYISKWPSVRWIEGEVGWMMVGPSRLREEGRKRIDTAPTLPAHFTLPAGLSLSGLYTLDFLLLLPLFPYSGQQERRVQKTQPRTWERHH